jgi:VIT family
MSLSQVTVDEEKGDQPSIASNLSGSSHKENHSNNSEYLEAAVLGMADGLTVPFALTAGLSS